MMAPWAEDEMEAADFGDARLDARAVVVVSEMGNRPNLSIPAACEGRAEMQAAYRFFDNDQVTFEKVLESHIQRTRARAAAQPVVLLVQDTTEIELSRPEQEVKGVGELDGARRGFLMPLVTRLCLVTSGLEALPPPGSRRDEAEPRRSRLRGRAS